MVIRDLDVLYILESACGNRYLATMFVAKLARRLGAVNKDYSISESKLIQWVLTGHCPYSTSRLETRRFIAETIDDLDDRLCYVDDEVVVDAVREMYKKSMRNKHLTYYTRNDVTPGQKSRINILLRMTWYHFSTI